MIMKNCNLCGKPIGGQHTLVNSVPYHNHCYKSKIDFEYDSMRIWPHPFAQVVVK